MANELNINQIKQAVNQKDIRSIIEFINNHGIETVTCYKPNGSEYYVLKMYAIFSTVLQHKDNKGAVIYEILLHFMKDPNSEQSLKEVLGYLGRKLFLEDGTIVTPTLEEFASFINYQDTERNTLLHYVVKFNNSNAIKVLFQKNANPLLKNKENKIPLDLAQEKTREVLIECMKEKAQSKKESARCNGLIGIIPGVFLGVGLGVGSALVPSMTIILCALAVSALVAGIAVGLSIYFLSQDYKQAKSIEKAVNPQSSLVNHAEASEIVGNTRS